MTQNKHKKIHALVLASSVAMDQDNTMKHNLKGTLQDKIRIEDFCYNHQKYRLHSSIQLSEESALKIKIDPNDPEKYDLIENEIEEEKPISDNPREDLKNFENLKFKILGETRDNLNSEKSFEQMINRNFDAFGPEHYKANRSSLTDRYELKRAVLHLIKYLSFPDYKNDLIDLIKYNRRWFYVGIILQLFKLEVISHLKGQDRRESLRNKLLEKIESMSEDEIHDKIIWILDIFKERHLREFADGLLEKIESKQTTSSDCIEEGDHKSKTKHNNEGESGNKEINRDGGVNKESRYNELVDFNQAQNNENQRRNPVNNNSQNQPNLDMDTPNKVTSFENPPNRHHPPNTNVNDDPIKTDTKNHEKTNGVEETRRTEIAEQTRGQKIEAHESQKNKQHKTTSGHKQKTGPEELRNLSDEVKPKTPKINKNLQIKNPERQAKKDKTERNQKYYPINDTTRPKIKRTIEERVKRKLSEFFDKCQNNENCILFMTGHGSADGVSFYLNLLSDAILTFNDILPLWNNRECAGDSHLLIVIDACYLGKWTEELQWNSDFRDITDVSIQTSSNQFQVSMDGGAATGGCFMNNFLYLNGMRDLFYNYDYRTIDVATNKPHDGQSPTFFSRLDDLENEFRLKVGFNDWESLEKRVRKNFKGIFNGTNGEFIEGEFRSIQLHGYGLKRLACGRVESGHFKNDNLDGRGRIEWEGMECEGTFVNGKLTEDYTGKLSTGERIPDLSKPFGGFRTHQLIIDSDTIKEIRTLNASSDDRVRYEWIKEISQNRVTIEGECRDRKRHGFNVVYENKRIVKMGIWQNDQFVKGVQVREDGSFVEIVQSSIGRYLSLIAPDSADHDKHNQKTVSSNRPKSLLMNLVYSEGFWMSWDRVGQTNEFRKADMTFIGNFDPKFRDCLPSGKGLFIQENGIHFEGHWQNGLPQGYGHYFNLRSNEAYSGHWDKGLREGFGKMVFSNRECYEGHWQSDRAIGRGKFTDFFDNCSEGLMILTDDGLHAEDSRIYGFSGSYHRVFGISVDLKRQLDTLETLIKDNKKMQNQNEMELVELIEKLSELKKKQNTQQTKSQDNQLTKNQDIQDYSIVDVEEMNELKSKIKEHEEYRSFLKDIEFVTGCEDKPSDLQDRLSEYNLIEILHEFQGTFWNQRLHGLCKYHNSSGEFIVNEFYNDEVLLRNYKLSEGTYEYEGDIIVQFEDYFAKIPRDDLRNRSGFKTVKKHGRGFLREYMSGCQEEFDGYFHLNAKGGIGKLKVTPLRRERVSSSEKKVNTDEDKINKSDSPIQLSATGRSEYCDPKNNENRTDDHNVNNVNDLKNRSMTNNSVFSEHKNERIKLNKNNEIDTNQKGNNINPPINQTNSIGTNNEVALATHSVQNHKKIPKEISNLEHSIREVIRLTEKNFYGLFWGNRLITKISSRNQTNSSKTGFVLMEKIPFQSTTTLNVHDKLFTNAVMVGYGIQYSPVSSLKEYSGIFFQNRREGRGSSIKKGNDYEGSFRSNLYWGCGNLTDNKQSTEYTGDFVMNMRHGSGRLKSYFSTLKDCLRVIDFEYSGSFRNDMYSGEGELVRKHVEKKSGIKFTGDGDRLETEVFSFHNTDSFVFTLTKHQGEILSGRLRYVIFRQAIEEPVGLDRGGDTRWTYFYFDDFTCIGISSCVHEDTIEITNATDLTSSDSCKNALLDKSKWYSKILRYNEIDEEDHLFRMNEKMEFRIQLRRVNNRMMIRVEKVLYEILEYQFKNNEEGYMRFNFVRNNNEMYQVMVNKKQKSKQSAVKSISVQKFLTETYKGQFKEGQKNGFGTLVAFDGSEYEGNFKGNRFHGKGTLKTPFGVKYEGEFECGLKSGNGAITWPCGQSYEGQFKNDLEHGRGCFSWKKRWNDFHTKYHLIIYRGDFKNGVMDGRVKYEYNEIDSRGPSNYEHFSYEGEFKNGHFEGVGNYTDYKHKTVPMVRFSFDKLILSPVSVKFKEMRGVLEGSTGSLLPNFKRIVRYDHRFHANFEFNERLEDSFLLFDALLECTDYSKIDPKQYEIIQNCKSLRGVTGDCVIVRKDGDRLELKFVFGFIMAFETVRLDDESLYSGEFLIKRRNTYFTPISRWTINDFCEFHCLYGNGLMVDSNDNIFMGRFSSGQMVEGIMLTKNGDLSVGKFLQGSPDGECEIWYDNGDVFQGCMSDHKKQGKGLLMTKSFIYHGEFQNDTIKGLGRLVNSDHQEYLGEFDGGRFEGKGKLYLTNDSTISGNFRNDRLSGFGRSFRNSINESVWGQYFEGKLSGYGNKQTGEGESYSGEFEKDSFSGYGEYRNHSHTYSGYFEKGKYHGYGVMKKDKYSFEGHFERGNKIGFGKIIYSVMNQFTCFGVFKDNKLTGPVKVEFKDKNYTFDFVDSKFRIQNCRSEMYGLWKFTGECLFKPGFFLPDEKSENYFKFGFLHGGVELRFSSEFVFKGDFNYDFHHKKIEFYDFLLLDFTSLDMINGFLVMKPRNQRLKEQPVNFDFGKMLVRLVKNYDFVKKENRNLLNKIFPAETQNLYKNKLSECLERDESSQSDFVKQLIKKHFSAFSEEDLKNSVLFHKYFKSESSSLSKLFEEGELASIESYGGSFKGGMWHKGKVVYKNEETLEGKFKNFRIKNFGKKTFKDRSNYEGKFRNDRMEGRGKITYPNRIVYKGHFVNDKIEKFGVLKIPKVVKIEVDTEDGLIVRRVKHKLLDNGLVYTGECLMRLKTEIKLSRQSTLDDYLEFVRVNGKGVYHEGNRKLESHFDENLKLVEEFTADGEIKTEIVNQSSNFSVVNSQNKNGVVVRHVAFKDQKDVMLVKLDGSYWFLGSMIDDERGGTGIMNFNGFKTMLLLFMNDELI